MRPHISGILLPNFGLYPKDDEIIFSLAGFKIKRASREEMHGSSSSQRSISNGEEAQNGSCWRNPFCKASNLKWMFWLWFMRLAFGEKHGSNEDFAGRQEKPP